MIKPVTTILSIEELLKRLDSFIEHNEVGTILPENFFTSIRALSGFNSDGRGPRSDGECLERNIHEGNESEKEICSKCHGRGEVWLPGYKGNRQPPDNMKSLWIKCPACNGGDDAA